MDVRPIDRLLPHLEAARCCGDGWIAKCPAHEDNHPSLSIREVEDGTVLLSCHAGCETQSVLAAVGLSFPDLFPHAPNHEGLKRSQANIVDVYEYTDEVGRPLFQVKRTQDKQFPQYHPDGRGGWLKGVEGVRRVPYRLPWLLARAQEGGLLLLAEGEKDVETLEKLGFVATTSPGGSNAWRDEYAGYFRGARVVIVPDNDEPGRKYANRLESLCSGKRPRSQSCIFPDSPTAKTFPTGSQTAGPEMLFSGWRRPDVAREP